MRCICGTAPRRSDFYFHWQRSRRWRSRLSAPCEASAAWTSVGAGTTERRHDRIKNSTSDARHWTPRGLTREVVAPGENRKAYLAGALDARDGHVVVVEGEGAPPRDRDR